MFMKIRILICFQAHVVWSFVSETESFYMTVNKQISVFLARYHIVMGKIFEIKCVSTVELLYYNTSTYLLTYSLHGAESFLRS